MKDETQTNGAGAERALSYERTPFIGQLFSRYLKPVDLRAIVASLAIGHGEELVHLRKFVGPKAVMYAFDIVPLDDQHIQLGKYVKETNTKYRIQDIGEVNRVKEIMGGIPQLVICRAPRILESITTKKFNLNMWWVDALSRYAEMVSDNGQMLITTYSKIEQDLLNDRFNQIGLHPAIDENQLCPDYMRGSLPSFQGLIPYGIDRFTLKVN